MVDRGRATGALWNAPLSSVRPMTATEELLWAVVRDLVPDYPHEDLEPIKNEVLLLVNDIRAAAAAKMQEWCAELCHDVALEFDQDDRAAESTGAVACRNAIRGR